MHTVVPEVYMHMYIHVYVHVFILIVTPTLTLSVVMQWQQRMIERTITALYMYPCAVAREL